MPSGQFSYKDSLGKCDDYSHHYGISSHYPPVNKVKHATAASRDVLVSAQQKVDQEVMHRFQSKDGKTAGVLLVTNVGKFFVLIVVFPPYFIVYAVPKWLATEMFPKAFEEMQKQWDKGIALMIELALWSKLKIFRPFKKLQVHFHEKYRKGIEKMHHFFERAKKRVEQIGLTAKQRTLDPAKEFIRRSAQAFSQPFSTAQGHVKQKYEKLQAVVTKSVKAMVKKLQSVANVSTPFTSFSQWVKGKSKKVWETLKIENHRTKEKAEQIVEKIKAFIAPPVEMVVRKMQEFQQKIGQAWQQVLQPIKEFCAPKIKAVKALLQQLNETVKERVSESMTKLAEWSKASFQWAKMLFSPLYQMTAQLTQNSLRLLPQSVAPLVKGTKTFCQKFSQKAFENLKFLTLKAFSLRHKLVEATAHFYNLLKRLGEKGKQTLKEGKKKALVLVKKVTKALLVGMEKGTIWFVRLILWLRLILAWIRVLTWYGMKLLPEFTAYILRKQHAS